MTDKPKALEGEKKQIKVGIVSVSLKKPFKVAGEEVSEVELNSNLKAKHILNASTTMNLRGIEEPTQTDQLLHLVSQATGILPEDLEEMAAADYLNLAGKVQVFLSPPSE